MAPVKLPECSFWFWQRNVLLVSYAALMVIVGGSKLSHHQVGHFSFNFKSIYWVLRIYSAVCWLLWRIQKGTRNRQILLYLVNQVQEPHQFRAHCRGIGINFTSLSLPIRLHSLLPVRMHSLLPVRMYSLPLEESPVGVGSADQNSLSVGKGGWFLPYTPTSRPVPG